MQKNLVILSHVPCQPSSTPSPRRTISCDSRLQPDTRNSMGTSGVVFAGLRGRGEASSELFVNSQNLASSSCGLKRIGAGKIAEQRGGVREEPQDSTVQLTPRFATTLRPGTLKSSWRNLFSQNSLMENPRNQISELHFGDFSDSADFQCWKVKTEVCSCSGCSVIAM